MEQDSETNIAPSDAELSCNTPTTGYYEPDFYLDVAATPLYSYIQDDLHYMKKPIHPYDKKGGQKHFHVPEEKQRGASVSRGSGSGRRPVSRPGMLTLVDQLAQRSMYETFSRSRSQSPGSAVSADEPIELAHYPDAKVPNPSLPAAIERDDFPAPPYAYSDPERRRRLSGRSDDVIDDEDEVDADREEDPKLKREEAELTKIASGIGKVFLHDLQARKQQRHQQLTHPDPRSTSRTPAANREPRYGMRYQNPVNASPSRFLHNRSLDEDLFYYRYHGYPPVGWATRDHSTLPSTYNSRLAPPERRFCTLPAAGRYGGLLSGGGGGGGSAPSVTVSVPRDPPRRDPPVPGPAVSGQRAAALSKAGLRLGGQRVAGRIRDWRAQHAASVREWRPARSGPAAACPTAWGEEGGAGTRQSDGAPVRPEMAVLCAV
ncbi:Actin-binding LIM protein 1 [Amphibalanus amphitrite]|uniref:Actin-binding LIM protein 1 n=1 Tax=Amphibalanus amphitrite TaxID=1232801 RepID=A0A6A4X2F2_AMPAM|nr:Actin-binding LIM protein 1 [Amphibalanus amphitrite]